MSKQLVVSADDFGFSRAYSAGNIRVVTEGVATVLALMSNMEAAPYAVDLRNRYAPHVEMSLHVNFVQGRPVSDPEDIPSLVNGEGAFYRSSAWRGDDPSDPKCVGDVYPTYEDLKRETEAQIERFRELTGSYPLHFEGHSTMTEPIRDAFRDIAAERGIHCSVQEPLGTDRMRSCSEMNIKGSMDILNCGCSVEDWLSGTFDVPACPYDIAILHFHPGYIDQFVLDNTSLTLPRCRDLETLCDPRVREWIDEQGIELVGYSALYR